MFRATCDNSVTTSPPASPPTANLTMSKCPPASPICTKPDRANPRHYPTTARQRLIATHHDSTFHPHTNPAGPAVSFPLRTLATLGFTAPKHQSRVRRMAHQHAHETSLCAADHGAQYRAIVAPDDSRLPDSPNID